MSIVWFSLHCLPYFAHIQHNTRRVEMFAHSLISTCCGRANSGHSRFYRWRTENARAKIIILIELTFGKQPRFFLLSKHFKCELFNNQDWIPKWFIDDDRFSPWFLKPVSIHRPRVNAYYVGVASSICIWKDLIDEVELLSLFENGVDILSWNENH